MDKAGIQCIVENDRALRRQLFARGFVFTDMNIDTKEYPFYDEWQIQYIDTYLLLVSPNQHAYVISRGTITAILIGHAYNPFLMIHDENIILDNLLNVYSKQVFEINDNAFWHNINELTGVFTLILLDGNDTYVIGDASGMQTAFYTVQRDKIVVSSHTNLIGDLLDLTWDPYVKHLVSYRFFKLLGNALPGDITQFKEVRRLIPNHYLRIHTGTVAEMRFYWPHKLCKSNKSIVDEVADLLHENIGLISKKWTKPAISLTGGCDSKTTLACANGLYNQFRYFSYVSSEAEKVDADAASGICKELGLPHKTYTIPESMEGSENIAEILNWNTGNIRYSHPEDVRKRMFFANTEDFDVEVKSWASEIGRAYYSKRFNGRTDFGGKPTSRKCTTLYKFFLNDRKLVKQTDDIFDEYLQRFFQQAKDDPIEWQEQFFWEFRVPSWNGLVITGEHRYSFDITIPYNNRRILELLLSASIKDRINDMIYKGIRALMNPSIDDTGISISNLKHTNNRAKLENIYYIVHTKLPF